MAVCLQAVDINLSVRRIDWLDLHPIVGGGSHGLRAVPSALNNRSPGPCSSPRIWQRCPAQRIEGIPRHAVTPKSAGSPDKGSLRDIALTRCAHDTPCKHCALHLAAADFGGIHRAASSFCSRNIWRKAAAACWQC